MAARPGWARLALLKTFDKVSLITRVFANECPFGSKYANYEGFL